MEKWVQKYKLKRYNLAQWLIVHLDSPTLSAFCSPLSPLHLFLVVTYCSSTQRTSIRLEGSFPSIPRSKLRQIIKKIPTTTSRPNRKISQRSKQSVSDPRRQNATWTACAGSVTDGKRREKLCKKKCIQYTWVRNSQNKGQRWEKTISFFNVFLLFLQNHLLFCPFQSLYLFFWQFFYISTQWRKRKTDIHRRFALTESTSRDNPETICHFQSAHAFGLLKKNAKLRRVYWFLQIQNADLQQTASSVVSKYLFPFFTCVWKITKCDY